jgi:hypothetical protein
MHKPKQKIHAQTKKEDLCKRNIPVARGAGAEPMSSSLLPPTKDQSHRRYYRQQRP